METIHHAAKTHGGLGWQIFDHKFRYKAAACRTLSWANIDMQLWLRIFTASSTQLREDYSLFSNRPSNKAGGAARDGICHSYSTTGVDLAHYDPIALTLTDVTEVAVWGTILGTNVHNPVRKTITATTTLHNPPVAARRPTKNRTVSLKCSIYNSSNSIPLDITIVTPIRVDALEGALCGHPNSSFV